MNRSMKQMLSALLAVAMVAALLVVPSVAADKMEDGIYKLSADTTPVTVKVGETKEIAVKAEYAVSADTYAVVADTDVTATADTAVATAAVAAGKLTITGVAAGTTNVVVTVKGTTLQATIPVTVEAAGPVAPTTGIFTLDVGEMVTAGKLVEETHGVTSPAAQYADLGTDGMFTIIAKASGNSTIEKRSDKHVFEDNYAGTHQFKTGGSVGDMTKLVSEGKCITFTTGAESVVKVWWVSGSSSGSSLAMANQVGDATPAECYKDAAKSEQNVGVIATIAKVPAGTNYLYSPDGTARFYKVEVNIANTPVPTPTEYNVTCAAAENGTVTTDVAKAVEGATVTVTATPAEGYELDTITVNGTAITGNTFTMPAQDVTVAATFKAVEETVYTVTADVKSVTVTAGSKKTVNVTVDPAGEIYAVSADTSIATVTVANGKVTITGVKEGKTTVTVGVVDGIGSAEIAVTVNAKSSGGGSSSNRPSNRPGTDEPATSTLPFTDVKVEDWFYDSVKKAFEKGLMKGTDETTFAPNASTTRAMVATVLFRMDGEKKTDVAGLFNDVEADSWYTDAVAWAAEKGIVLGYDETTFAPNDNVTREQLVVMLYRYAAVTEKSEKDLSAFADAASVSEWATEAMTWAVEKGIILGKGNSTLDPQGVASRAEVCTMLVRFLEMK